MDTAWQEKVLRLAYSSSQQDALEYVSLVYQVEGKVTLDIARVLMRTFSNKPDYSVQESVVAVLASAAQEVYVQALLEELPRLQREARDWADSLVDYAINFFPEALVKIARRMGPSAQRTLIETIKGLSIQRDTRNGQNVLEALT